MTTRLQDCNRCIDEIISRLGRHIVLGTPLGIGKPIALLNALYQRAKDDPEIQLDIITALSLNPPVGKSGLEERFLQPIRDRVWPGYPRLVFQDDALKQCLPANVRVIEFYLQSGSALHNAEIQQHYISSNYTHVARDMIGRGVNLLLQAVAVRELDGKPVLSLSSNPDVTLQILPLMRELQRPWLAVAQINRKLPWMGGDAVVDDDVFDLIVDDPALDHLPFAVPHEPVSIVDWAIGLHASAQVVDGGTLQVGIGTLGDAACHALRLRNRDNAQYQRALKALKTDDGASVQTHGFDKGLYVASELISNPLFSLFEDGIVHRCVYELAAIQLLADAGDLHEEEELPADVFERLWRTGALPASLSMASLEQLQRHGLASQALQLEHGELVLPDGVRLSNDLNDPAIRASLNRHARGPGLRDGIALLGAFFIGPTDFYERLRALSQSELARIDMTSVGRVNDIVERFDLEQLQRRRARFINITMKATLMGAAVSDQLADGQVVSGVGGQYNFVAMAHQLRDARSILLLRAVHGSGRTLQSNIIWDYPHATIPRHLRDVFITEYGVADLRGRTDEECISRMIEIADSRFQDELIQQARHAGKLGADYHVPETARQNLPQHLKDRLKPFTHDGTLPDLPFGCDLTAQELELAAALGRLKSATTHWRGRLKLLRALALPATKTDAGSRFALNHLRLDRPESLRQSLLARMVRAAFKL